MRFYKIIQLMLVGGFLFLLPQVSFANNVGIEVDQTAVVFDVETGETQQFVVKVKNISDENQKVIIDAKDYVLSENNELTLVSDENEHTGLSNWLESDSKLVELKSDEEKEVVFTLSAPGNATIGSHKGAALFKVEGESDDTVKVNGQIGVHVLVNVKGDTHASGRVNKFDIPLLSFGPVKYAVEFENLGNIHYVPYGEVVVRNIFTKQEKIYEYEKHFVFPGNKFNFIINEKIPSLFGLYKATTIFVDGEGATRSKTDFTFGYFFPVIAIFVMIVVVVLFKMINKTNGKNKLNKKTGTKKENVINMKIVSDKEKTKDKK